MIRYGLKVEYSLWRVSYTEDDIKFDDSKDLFVYREQYDYVVWKNFDERVMETTRKIFCEPIVGIIRSFLVKDHEGTKDERHRMNKMLRQAIYVDDDDEFGECSYNTTLSDLVESSVKIAGYDTYPIPHNIGYNNDDSQFLVGWAIKIENDLQGRDTNPFEELCEKEVTSRLKKYFPKHPVRFYVVPDECRCCT